MTVPSWNTLADRALGGEILSRGEAHTVLDAPDVELPGQLAAAWRVRHHHWGNRVRLHFLLNAQSGLCPEDCHYCSQSKVSVAEIEKYPMKAMDEILSAAGRAAELKAGEKGLEREVLCGYCGDLLSDVMANSQPGAVWLTVQSHQNIIAVAVLRELAAIVLVNGRSPDEDTRSKAEEESIPLLVTSLSAYDLACRMRESGIGRAQG